MKITDTIELQIFKLTNKFKLVTPDLIKKCQRQHMNGTYVQLNLKHANNSWVTL